MSKISFSEEVYAVCSQRPLLVSTGTYPYVSVPAGKQLLLELDAVARVRFYIGNTTGTC